MIFSKQKSLPKTIFGRAFYLDLFVHCFLHSHSHSNGHTDHGVVTGAQETHHLHVSGDGRGTGELAGTEEEPANWASECIRPMVSVMP